MDFLRPPKKDKNPELSFSFFSSERDLRSVEKGDPEDVEADAVCVEEREALDSVGPAWSMDC